MSSKDMVNSKRIMNHYLCNTMCQVSLKHIGNVSTLEPMGIKIKNVPYCHANIEIYWRTKLRKACKAMSYINTSGYDYTASKVKTSSKYCEETFFNMKNLYRFETLNKYLCENSKNNVKFGFSDKSLVFAT